jgi:hypothetical protein
MKILKEIAYSVVLVLYVAGISFATGRDYCEVHREAEPKLCAYEPTTIGYTHDSDDTGFMDFKISVRYQLFPAWITRGQNYLQSGLGDNSALYFAFTGRFGQYIGTRDSSPVVEKLFNPKLFYRLWTDPAHEDHVDLALAHESNGQSIDSQAEYQSALATSANQNEVKDQLSRGWDYWEISWKKTVYERPASTTERPNEPCVSDAGKNADTEASGKRACSDCDNYQGIDRKKSLKTSIESYLGLKYFLAYGPLEGPQENYNYWENDPQGKRLNRVSGLSAMLKWVERGCFLGLSDLKVAAQFETGIRETFRYNTYRIEVGTKVLQLPMSVWWQTGYNSDLAQYYKQVDSYGVQVEIGSF